MGGSVGCDGRSFGWSLRGGSCDVGRVSGAGSRVLSGYGHGGSWLMDGGGIVGVRDVRRVVTGRGCGWYGACICGGGYVGKGDCRDVLGWFMILGG